jgi:hypothetical protein
MYKLIWVIIVVFIILLISFLYCLQLHLIIYLLCGFNLVSRFILSKMCQIWGMTSSKLLLEGINARQWTLKLWTSQVWCLTSSIVFLKEIPEFILLVTEAGGHLLNICQKIVVIIESPLVWICTNSSRNIRVALAGFLLSYICSLL